jgi:adenylate cyclase
MAEERVQRKLAAILVADVVGYSRLMEADEEGTRVRLRSLHSELIDPKIAADGGRIVKTMGDGILVEFPSVVDAVRDALDIQGAMRRRNADVAEANRIEFRIGINVGDVIIEGGDIHGDGVNVASRLEGLCEPGEVYVSGTVYDQAAGKLAATFDDLGEKSVKNITKPVRVYRAREVTGEQAGYKSADAPPPLPDKPSIAVLPFDNMSGDPEQEYFVDGICEDTITALSRIRWFFVIARNSTFAYKGKSTDVRDVARELGVRYVVEGSVRKAGNRIRLTAQLIDGTNGVHLWAERYDRAIEDIFDLQDELTQTIVGAIEPELSRAEQERAQLKKPETLDVWDVYQRGMSELHRLTADSLSEAAATLTSVTETDPDFAAAYAGLADVY